MFDMGWLEFGIVGLAMILVLGPKELPHAMRTIARYMRKARRLAGEFQGHMDDLVREADLAEVRDTVQSIKNKDIGSAVSEALDPTGELTKDLTDTLQDAEKEMNAIKSSAGSKPSSAPQLSEPQTTTPTADPRVEAPAAAPKTEAPAVASAESSTSKSSAPKTPAPKGKDTASSDASTAGGHV